MTSRNTHVYRQAVRINTSAGSTGSGGGNSGAVAPTSQVAAFWSKEQSDLFQKWESSFRKYSEGYNNPYFDYFYTGQDIQIMIEGLVDQEDILPIYSFGYLIEQQKQPIYGFWDYCVDNKTQALTKRGWLNYDEINEQDTILSMGPSGELVWSKVLSVYRNKDFKGKLFKLSGYRTVDALVTPGHKFALSNGRLKEVDNLNKTDEIRLMGSEVKENDAFYSDALVEISALFKMWGSVNYDLQRVEFVVPDEFLDIVLNVFKSYSIIFSDHELTNKNKLVGLDPQYTDWYEFFSKAAIKSETVFGYSFITSMNSEQRSKFLDLILLDHGKFMEDKRFQDTFQFLLSLTGNSSKVYVEDGKYKLSFKDAKECLVKCGDLLFPGLTDRRRESKNEATEHYEGVVWCPETEYGTFVCRRNNLVYVTGNTYSAMLRGTRIISGAFNLVTMGPNYFPSKIAKAAEIRSKANTNRKVYNNLNSLRGIDDDEANIDKFWSRHYDNNFDENQQHLFSIHPPFNLMIKFGLQETSLISQNPSLRVNELRNKFYDNNPMSQDYNERLIKNPSSDNDMVLLLENVEIVNRTMSFDTEGNPILETYTFTARDERLVPETVYTTPKLLPDTDTRNKGDKGRIQSL